MLVELVSFLNDDGLHLDGAFYPPTREIDRAGTVDAVLLIHGSRGNFYDGATKSMAEDLSARGYACLPLNTNAHDTAWYDPGIKEFKGNAFEILDSTCIDIQAGINHLTERGYQSIGLLGHSMGAVRVVYYAATHNDSRISTVMPISPVRLSYSYFMESEDAEEFTANITIARQLISTGEPQALLRVDHPIPQLFSANSFLDKHGPEEKYNLINHAHKIIVPMLTLNGSLETHSRLRNMAQDLAAAAINSPNCKTLMIDGGEHSLVNRTDEASEAILEWLSTIELAPRLHYS